MPSPVKPRMTRMATNLLDAAQHRERDGRPPMQVSLTLMDHARRLEAHGLVTLAATQNADYPWITEHVVTLTDAGRERQV